MLLTINRFTRVIALCKCMSLIICQPLVVGLLAQAVKPVEKISEIKIFDTGSLLGRGAAGGGLQEPGLAAAGGCLWLGGGARRPGLAGDRACGSLADRGQRLPVRAALPRRAGAHDHGGGALHRSGAVDAQRRDAADWSPGRSLMEFNWLRPSVSLKVRW